MPPSEQEQRCAEAVQGFLAEQTGRPWRQEEWNDDIEDDARSFDLRLSDGRDELLVEITRLTDGPEFSKHDDDVHRLHRALSPDPTRDYCLYLPPPYVLRLDRRQVRQLRRGIKRAAAGLSIGDKAPVLVPKQGILRFMRIAEPGYVACHHGDSWPLSELSSETNGVYFLNDDWRFDHQFLTAECESEFRRSLAKACTASRKQGQVAVGWREEWELQRLRNPTEGEGGVLVVGFVADFVESAAINSIRRGLDHGRAKLSLDGERTSVAVALHAGEHQHTLSLRQFEDAIAGLSPRDVWPLEAVFLVHGDRVYRHFSFDHAAGSRPAIPSNGPAALKT